MTSLTDRGGDRLGGFNTPASAASPTLTRTRPAYEKLLVGPMMVFGEMITGGHYLEVLRLGKQMSVGSHAAPSYWSLHKTFVLESGGFAPAFYRGFLPWGLLQCAKGVPVLFVQNESMYQLQARAGWSPNSSEKASGFMGGAAQAIFVNPMQKIKVTVVASDTMNALPPLQACRAVVHQHGFAALYDGILPHVTRRSLDWGIRFGVSSEVKNLVLRRKRANGQSEEMQVHELMGCGLIGGAVSAMTHPIDNVITNSQKPLPPGASRDLLAVVQRMYRESGMRAFARGWDIKVIDSTYHMAWMYGVGTIAYELMHNALQDAHDRS